MGAHFGPLLKDATGKWLPVWTARTRTLLPRNDPEE
jgi:hypothetical protein